MLSFGASIDSKRSFIEVSPKNQVIIQKVMVSSPAPKKKRISHVTSSSHDVENGVFEVENVIGYKLVKSELRFFVQCEKFVV